MVHPHLPETALVATFKQRRCQHCQVVYTYQPSGFGCIRPENSGSWCPGCKTVIDNALQSVPPRVERFWEPVESPTCAELVALEKERWDKGKAEGKIMARRVFSPLFDLTGEKGVEQNGQVMSVPGYSGLTFRYNYWSKLGVDTGEVKVEMERDLQTGETQPYRRLKRGF